jgi:hypothetical protein
MKFKSNGHRVFFLTGVLAVGFLAGLFFGCAVTPTTPQQTIYQATTNYNAAATMVIAYKALPPCGQSTSPPVCSKPEIIQKLKDADNVAYNALVAAENTARTPGAGANAATALTAANQAIAALVAITSTLQVK